LRLNLEEDRAAGKTIGFVPTMGALHRGHMELIKLARQHNDRVVISIFVNPLQFGPSEDFESYPRDSEGDFAKAQQAGVDYLFEPSVEEMYPGGKLETRVEVSRIGEILEGHFRPGHFAGVATVCVKLFNIIGPDRAYFGEKDAQQLAVIRQVVRDLDLPVEIVGCPTVRDPDGLASSSRNLRLDSRSRKAATVLSRALFEAERRVLQGERSSAAIKRLVSGLVAKDPRVDLQYVEVVDPESFEPLEEIAGPATIALAAFVGRTRLIDNVTVEPGGTDPPILGGPIPRSLHGIAGDRASGIAGDRSASLSID
jgi:pantoate--beta-alanine ligase